MPTRKNTAAMNLASASLAGVVTLLRPARFPRWARRGLSWSNTAGTAGSVFLTVSKRDDLPADHPLPKAISASDLLAAASGGVMLVTSGLGMKADARVEAFLVRHGFKHPRIWMALGVVGAAFLAKTVQDRASGKAEELKERLEAKASGTGGAPRSIAELSDDTPGDTTEQTPTHRTTSAPPATS